MRRPLQSDMKLSIAFAICLLTTLTLPFPATNDLASADELVRRGRSADALVTLNSHALQEIDGALSVRILAAGIQDRRLWLAADVIDTSPLALSKVAVMFFVEKGRQRTVHIAHLQPGSARTVNIEIKLRHGRRPEIIGVTHVTSYARYKAKALHPGRRHKWPIA